MSALKKLENWVAMDRPRRCRVEIDTGFGATCWECVLEDVALRRRVIASEVFFFEGPINRQTVDKEGWKVDRVACSQDDFSSPEEVILLALTIWENA